MDKAERLKLIRALHSAKAGCMAFQPSGKPIRPNTDPIDGPGFGVCYMKGPCLHPHMPREGGLIFAPMPKKDMAPRPERRRKGETALTRISRQLPAKLPRVLL
jgi:hypothetical protein